MPVELVGSIIKERLAEDDCKEGYILDGYPRSIAQADMLETINSEINGDIKSDFRAIYFDLNHDVLISRIVNRRSCPVCGEIYNIKFKPSKVEGVCDKCGAKLIQRKDDNEATGIEHPESEVSGEVELFNLQGVRLSQPVEGEIMVVRKGSEVSKEIR